LNYFSNQNSTVFNHYPTMCVDTTLTHALLKVLRDFSGTLSSDLGSLTTNLPGISLFQQNNNRQNRLTYMRLNKKFLSISRFKLTSIDQVYSFLSDCARRTVMFFGGCILLDTVHSLLMNSNLRDAARSHSGKI